MLSHNKFIRSTKNISYTNKVRLIASYKIMFNDSYVFICAKSIPLLREIYNFLKLCDKSEE